MPPPKKDQTVSSLFKPNVILSRFEWEEQVQKMKQNIYDKRNENNKTSKETKNQKNIILKSESETSNIVKIVD